MLIRLEVMTGRLSSALTFAVTQVKAALGTLVAMVGILASCQPIPVLISVAPASSNLGHVAVLDGPADAVGQFD
jgi:hypothetical protein